MIKTQREKLNLLLKAFEEQNEKEFEFFLDYYAISSQASLKGLGIDMTIIEYILQTSKSSNFIKICFDYGDNFYKKNQHGLYLFHYAIQSMCAENINSLIKYLNMLENEEHQKIRSHLISYKSPTKNVNNYLHDVIERLTSVNYEDCLKIVKILLRNGCNPNHLNVDSKSPFDMLLEKVQKKFPAREMIETFLENSIDTVEISGSNDIIDRIVNDLNMSDKVKIRSENEFGINHLYKSIRQGNESQFILLLKKADSQEISVNLAELMRALIEANFVKGVRYVMEYSNYNEVYTNGQTHDLLSPKFIFKNTETDEKTPLFYALSLCRHAIVDEFLQFMLNDSDIFKNRAICQNVLHEICSLKNVESDEDFIKCFDAIIKDKRCDKDMINAFDYKSKTPLMYACENGHKMLILELLRRGAYIGYKNIIDNLSENILKKYLDECIVPASDLSDQDCAVQINFSSLIPPEKSLSRHKETKAFKMISLQPKFENLITHPVFTSFLELKWKRVNFLIYSALSLYFICFVYLSVFILNFFNHDIYNKPIGTIGTRFSTGEINSTLKDINVLKVLFGRRTKRDAFYIENTPEISEAVEYIQLHKVSYIISLLITIALSICEIVQMIFSRKKYFLKLSNWVDCTLLSLAYIVLLNSFDFDPDVFRKLRAILFLVIAMQSFILLAMVSKLSLQLEIFKKVSKTFLKFILFYFMLIFAFVMAFYTLHGGKPSSEENDEENGFQNILLSTITVIRMMLSDFDGIKLEPNNQFNSIMFLLFVLLITIILFNLLNALAITDTQEIIKFAERVDVRKRISMVNNCERILTLLNIDFFDIYCTLIRDGRIVLKINKDNYVRVKNRSTKKYTTIKYSLDSSDSAYIEVPEKINTNKYCKVHVPQLIPYTKIHKKFLNLTFLNSKLTLSSENIEKITEHIKNLITNEKQTS